VEKGTRPGAGISSDKFVPRPEIVERLKRIFQPYEDQSFYYMVCGEHGTGKTTLTRIASSEVGHGVIYVDVAVLPVQGKIINVEKAERAKIIENEEIKNLINALGFSVSEATQNHYNRFRTKLEAETVGE